MDKHFAIDITAVEADAAATLDREATDAAKKKLLAKMRQIRDAQKIVSNLELEYEALKLELKAG